MARAYRIDQMEPTTIRLGIMESAKMNKQMGALFDVILEIILLDVFFGMHVISFDISCIESRCKKEEEALTVLSSKITKPMSTVNRSVHKSEYDRFCDRLVTWNKDVCRKETGTIAGKGISHSSLGYFSQKRMRIRFTSCFALSGVFALTDLPKDSVVAKYEGHLVSTDGKIQVRCTRTDILFSYRAELNREWTKTPFSQEHCASVMVFR